MSAIFLNLNDELLPEGALPTPTEDSAWTTGPMATGPMTIGPVDWAAVWTTPQFAVSALPQLPLATPSTNGGDGPTTGEIKPPPPPTTPGTSGPLPVISMVDRVVSEDDGFVDLIFTLSAPAQQVVTASWTAAGSATGGGAAGSDFGAISGSLSFAVGESTKTVRIVLTDDSVDEVIENFSLSLGNAVNATLQRSQTLVTIVDNDGATGTPVISVRDANVDEAAGTATFSVQLDRPSSGTVTVGFGTSAGTAAAGTDFTASSGTLSFSAGQTVRTVTVAIGNDSAAEVTERFQLLLSAASGATVGDAVGTAIIGANDQATSAVPQISVADTRVSEGDGYVELVFMLSAPSASVASVAWSTAAGSALADSDFKTSTGTLSFRPGQTIATLRLDIADSATIESTESFSLTLSGAVNASLADSTVGITLVDDDGARVLSYGLGDDRYLVTAATDVIVENIGGGDDLATASVSYVLGEEVEDLTLGGTSAINGTGNGLANTITGNSGNNVIDGGAGNDTMVGGAGNDSYVVASAGDIVTEASGGGTADKVTSSIAWTLGTEIEMLTLSGSSAINGTGNTLANTITGNTGNNLLAGSSGNDTISGGSGNDSLDGGTGNDSLVGGAGNDSYTVDSSTDLISETSTLATEIDSVTSGVAWTLGSNLEKLTLTGSTAINGAGNTLANTITGNTGNNLLAGSSGNDTISGGSGNDSLDGGTGNDTLDGGTGNDFLQGGTGNDSYTVDSSGDVVSETSTVSTEIDSVSSSVNFVLGSYLEKLTLTGTSGLSGTGNALANTVTGNTGNNLLAGRSGNDTLIGDAGNDTLDGGTGNDSLVGGTGNDSYTVDSSSDVISETSTLGTEIDSVFSSATFTLGNNLEFLSLTGTAAINGTGNTLGNTISGNTGNNVLSGLGGNDTLTGGEGIDTFRFASAISSTTNIDVINDFVKGEDRIELENSIFTKFGATGVLTASNFVSSSTGLAVDSNDYVLFETDTGRLFYDADGSGSGASVLIATLGNAPALANTDIFLT